MNTENAAMELRSAADTLDAVVAEGERPNITEPVSRLETAAEQAHAAWSGSWFGYHSRVYYQDFQTPPAGARFNIEWGFMPAFSNTTRGDWVELTYEDAIAGIKRSAGDPDLAPGDRIAEKARSLFDDV